MKRIAFIDVQNTEITTLKLLGFSTDNERLFTFLKDKWHCDDIFFYPGIEHGDSKREGIFLRLESLGATVRSKYFFVYRQEDKIIKTNCQNCDSEVVFKIKDRGSWKCNCDVELAVDVVENIKNTTEIFLFSGDGDFEFLINKAIDAGIKVNIVSSAKKIKKLGNMTSSRLSSKILRLTKMHSSLVKFLEIDNIKFQIKVENEKAAKRDLF